MKQWIIRKPPMYREMRDASFSPGIIAAIVITLFLWFFYVILREIPASAIDFFYISQHPVSMYSYRTSPGTMLFSLELTGLLIVLVIMYVRRIEQRPLSTIGITLKHTLRRYGWGYALGVLLMAAWSLWMLLTWDVTYTGLKPVALLFIPAYMVQAEAMEVLYRGYMLSALTRKTGVIPAVLISSALNALLNYQNPGSAISNITMVFLLSVLAALLTVRTNSIRAACGLHAAWNFTSGLVFPVIYGNLYTDYTMFKRVIPLRHGVFGHYEILPAFALVLVLIALTLFAGKNRLVVRPTEEEQAYFRALRIAKAALRFCKDDFGKPYIRHSAALSQELEGAPSIAVLLVDACNTGSLYADSLVGFDSEVMGLVTTLVHREETDLAYMTRIKSDPAALAVWTAKRDFEEKLLIRRTPWNKRKTGNAPAPPDTVRCPMLRSEILLKDCADIAAQVDSYADDEAHAAVRRLDRSLCQNCPHHTPSGVSHRS